MLHDEDLNIFNSSRNGAVPLDTGRIFHVHRDPCELMGALLHIFNSSRNGQQCPPLVRTTLSALTTFPICYAICMRNHRIIIGNVVCLCAMCISSTPHAMARKSHIITWLLFFFSKWCVPDSRCGLLPAPSALGPKRSTRRHWAPRPKRSTRRRWAPNGPNQNTSRIQNKDV